MPKPPLPTSIAPSVKSRVQQPSAHSLPKLPTPQRFLTANFDPQPSAANVGTHAYTQLILQKPEHPFHIRTVRRFAAFDPTILHWTVKAPVDISKKAVVRNWAVRRVREAVRAELKVRGYGLDGRALAGDRGPEGERREGLRGALAVYLDRNMGAVIASGEEVRKEAARVVDIVQQQSGSEKGLSKRSRGRETARARSSERPARLPRSETSVKHLRPASQQGGRTPKSDKTTTKNS